jgi:hypothetical protein
MPTNYITSFANRDSTQIYPACVTTGITTIKPNNLNTYTASDFSTDIPSLAMQTITAGTTVLAAWTSCVNSVNTFKSANSNTIDIKFLDVKFHSFSATSHTCMILFIIFRI